MNYSFPLTTNSITNPQPNVLSQSLWIVPQPTVANLAANFDPISLQQMDAVALLNRVDTKFVMTTDRLLTALAQIQPDYRILSINGQHLNHYSTLYFDTPNFSLYHAHVNDRAERYKVRSREYVDSHLSFLEVKHKTRKGRTIKDRIPTVQPMAQMTAETENWLRRVAPLDSGALEPKLRNTFTRLMLVSKQHCERVTLDVDLTFHTDDKVVRLNGIAIAEVKMDASHGDSSFLEQMRAQKIRQSSFSKYAIGVAMLYSKVKKNSLKPKLLWLGKTMKGIIDHERFC